MAINWIEGVLNNSKHTGTDLLLMLLLAESADRESGSCYPGQARLAKLMRASERTVQRTIKALADSGEITVKQQKSHLGTNLYILNPTLLTKASPTEMATPTKLSGVTEMAPSSPTDLSSPSPTEMADKPSVLTVTGDKSPYSEDFESFWRITNKKGGKLDAFKAWKKLRAGDHKNATDSMPVWVDAYDRLGWAYDVSRWLNGRMWESEVPRQQPTNGHKAPRLTPEQLASGNYGKVY